MNRRSVLKGCAAGVASLSLAGWRGALAAGQVPSSLTVSPDISAGILKLSDSLSVITGVGGNVVALAKSDGVLLVDSGAAAKGVALQNQLRALPGDGRVHTVFNTHWHFDHTGSNEVFGRMGAKIIAHEKTRLALATDRYVPGEDRYQKARVKEAIPTESFYTTGALSVGGERIEYGYLLEAHTDGDIYVYFRDSNVLAVGGALSPDRDPELDWFSGGWVGGRIDALALVLKLSNEQTRIIAASGPVAGRAQLQTELDMMQQIYDRMVDLVRKGYTTKDMLDAGVMDKLSRKWTDPQKFLHDAHKGIWAHHNTLAHDVV